MLKVNLSSGLVVLLLILVTTVYQTGEKQAGEAAYAERLVMVHKKLQQVPEENYQPVQFIQNKESHDSRLEIAR